MRDASKASPLEGLLGAMQNDSGNLVSEVQGAAEAKLMKELPCEGTVGKEGHWEKLGFKLGEPGAQGDKLFREVIEQPDGWKLERNPHGDVRHMSLVDDKGRKRGTMFYKNASYDRKASIGLITRFRVEHGSALSNNYDDERFFVSDTTQSKYDSHYTVLFMVDEEMSTTKSSFESEWGWRDAQRKKCVAWLAEHYPNYDDPTVYWDDEVEGERIEVTPDED